MPLQPADISPDVATLALSTLRTLASRSLLVTSRLRGAEPNELALTQPHHAFTINLQGIEARSRLVAARPAAIRFLVQRSGTVVAAAGLVMSGGSYIFSGVNEGPFVGSTVDAFDRAAALAEVQAGSYTANLLTIPSLNAVALWLNDPHSARDRILPLSPAPPPLTPYQDCSPADFFEPLESAAGRLLASPPAPRFPHLPAPQPAQEPHDTP